jgi:hypothetical protein
MVELDATGTPADRKAPAAPRSPPQENLARGEAIADIAPWRWPDADARSGASPDGPEPLERWTGREAEPAAGDRDAQGRTWEGGRKLLA